MLKTLDTLLGRDTIGLDLVLPRWQTRKKPFNFELLNFGNTDLAKKEERKKTRKITTNLKSRPKILNQIFNPCALFFFLLTGTTG